MISKLPPLWNFNLTWSVHTDKMISKFPPPWNFKWTWTVHKDKMISKFAPPRNFKWTWTVHKDKMIPKFPPHGTSKYLPPWNFKLTWTVQHHLREVIMSFLVKRMQIWWVSYVSGTQPCSHFAGAGLEVATISHRGGDCKWIFRFKSSMLNNCNPIPFHHEFRISNSLFLCFPGFSIRLPVSNSLWIVSVSESACRVSVSFRVLVSESVFLSFWILVSESACFSFRSFPNLSVRIRVFWFPNPNPRFLVS